MATDSPTTYTTEQADALAFFMEGVQGRASARTVPSIAKLVGLKPRLVRALLSNLDGVRFRVCLAGQDGLYIAHDPPTAAEREALAATTANHRSRAASLLARARRCDAYEAAREPMQQALALGAPLEVR